MLEKTLESPLDCKEIQPVYPKCAGELSKVGLGCMHIPGLSHSRFRFSGTPQRCILRWACVLCPFQFQAAQATRCLVSTLSPDGAVCLLWGADLWLQPSWWMSTVQGPRKTWLATGSLLRVWWGMPSLGPRLTLSLWLWLLPTCLSASGEEWAGLQQASSPLVFT